MRKNTFLRLDNSCILILFILLMDMEGNFKWAFAYHSFYVNF
jgi:hypothetical protein